MSLSQFSGLVPVAANAQTWGATGIGNLLMTFNGIANGVAEQGAKSGSWLDSFYGMPEELDFRLEAAVSNAVSSSGLTLDLYLGQSDSPTAGTNNPGNLTGADAVWANPTELTGQLDFIGSLSLSATRGTNVQVVRFRFYDLALPYFCPVIVNNSGQTLASSGNKLVVTPYYRAITSQR